MPSQLTRTSIVLWVMTCLPGCATHKPITTVVPEKIVVTKYVPVPAPLLAKHCAELRLTDIRTEADLESFAVSAWICSQDSNKDKDAIGNLKAP